jgi:glutamine amidotransferase
VRRIETALKLPQIGWNALEFARDCAIAGRAENGRYVYFVHSYAVYPAGREDLVAVCDYGGKVPALVARGHGVGASSIPKRRPVGFPCCKNSVPYRGEQT